MAKKAVNPISLKNLNRKGTKPRYDEPKKPRRLTVTDSGWQQAKAIAKRDLGLSVSELVERIGRGELIVAVAKDN